MSSNESKKLGLAEIVLFGVCTVLVVDTVAASAIAGPGGMVWWLILLFTFFLPYGLITAELTTTYPAEGGIYDWVKRAFGRRWGARTAWLYWINYAMWIPAVFYLFAVVIGQIFNLSFSPWTIALISIAMSWFCSWISTKPVADAAWISTTRCNLQSTDHADSGYWRHTNGPDRRKWLLHLNLRHLNLI